MFDKASPPIRPSAVCNPALMSRLVANLLLEDEEASRSACLWALLQNRLQDY